MKEDHIKTPDAKVKIGGEYILNRHGKNEVIIVDRYAEENDLFVVSGRDAFDKTVVLGGMLNRISFERWTLEEL